MSNLAGFSALLARHLERLGGLTRSETIRLLESCGLTRGDATSVVIHAIASGAVDEHLGRDGTFTLRANQPRRASEKSGDPGSP